MCQLNGPSVSRFGIFSKHLWNLTIPQKLWVSALFEVGWSRTVAAKIGVFRPLFLEKMFCFINLTPETPPSVIHGCKATDLLYELVKKKFHPVRCQIFGDALKQTFCMISKLVIGKLPNQEPNWVPQMFTSYTLPLPMLFLAACWPTNAVAIGQLPCWRPAESIKSAQVKPQSTYIANHSIE